MSIAKVSRFLYVFGLCLFAAALPLSKSFLTIAQIVLGLSWVLQLDQKVKVKYFLENRILWWFLALWLLHFLFLINSSDFDFARHDIIMKSPFFVLPFVVGSSKQLDTRELKWILSIFSAAVIAGALIVIGKYIASELGWINKVLEKRDLSPFTSHIRFSLMICLTIAILAKACKEKNTNVAVFVLATSAMVLAMLLMQVMTGIFIIAILLLPLLFYFFDWNYQRHIKKTVLLIALIIVCGIGCVYSEINDILVPKETQVLHGKTALGNPYFHDTSNPLKENGYYVYRNVCESEMATAWNLKSSIAYDSLDHKKQPIKNVLLRYLASLGGTKDAAAVMALSSADIQHIEEGEANATNANSNPLRKRLREMLWEIDVYKQGGNVSHNSLSQRFIYWKTATEIVSDNMLFGVGTGDVQLAFNERYTIDKSTLPIDVRRRAHNQFITFWISFGLFGFLFFIAMLLHLGIFSKYLNQSFLARVFLVIIVLSMLNEDTVETQAGVSFFSFFFALFWADRKSV